MGAADRIDDDVHHLCTVGESKPRSPRLVVDRRAAQTLHQGLMGLATRAIQIQAVTPTEIEQGRPDAARRSVDEHSCSRLVRDAGYPTIDLIRGEVVQDGADGALGFQAGRHLDGSLLGRNDVLGITAIMDQRRDPVPSREIAHTGADALYLPDHIVAGRVRRLGPARNRPRHPHDIGE
jgi:hypothetical protein